MSASIVITRPLAQAQPLSQRIAALGLSPVIFPLLDIEPLRDTTQLDAALASLRDYALAVFVSPNAIDAVFARISEWPAGVAVAVVGAGSRKRLAHHGLTSANATIISPGETDRMDSEALLPKLDLDALRGKRVLIIRGETGRELLTDALRSASIDVTQLPAYRRLAPEMTEARCDMLRQLAAGDSDWIVTSSEALRILVQQAGQALGAQGLERIQNQRIIVPHPRIAECAEELGFRRLVQAESGDDGLLSALQAMR